MILRELLRGVEVVSVSGELDQAIGDVRDDSRQLMAGDLFVALVGHASDGHDFVKSAIERGARALVVEREVETPASAVVVRVKSTANALGVLAANRFGAPAAGMALVGVTGTNGKTTTTHLVESILRAAGARPGIIGTVSYRYGDVERAAELTTPGALALQRLLREMRDAGTTHVVMEVSSIALDQARLSGAFFRVAAFTNLTQDHLDYHGSMERYEAAKALLFSRYLRPGDGVAVAFTDYPAGARMLANANAPHVACSARDDAAAGVRVRAVRLAIEGIEAELVTPRGPLTVRSPLLAEHNLQNMVVAVGIAEALHLPQKAITQGIAALRGVPGRLERVEIGSGVAVLVDYAHTPDALERAIAAMRPLTAGKLLVVFGCGGDRDRTKRPIMGRIAALGADVALITSDNPRTEDPKSIVEMIVSGAREARGKAAIETLVDRRAAIRRAIEQARPGDVVLIAGKGHEDYQILGTEKIHFDDREEARAAAASLRHA
jgi:UDP-N-acetylmuramoyl-L-alanyl-D-glutamate--2,6-diaminopimelate ligase